MQTPKSAGIYCRLSFSPDGSVEKVERQEADCRRLAKQLGWKVRDVYPDNSRSAWRRDRKRPQWQRMLDDIEAGVLDGILVYHGDRLMRQPKDLEKLLDLTEDRNLPLASPSGTRNLSNEDDRFALRIEVAQACRSSADTSRRVKRGIEARAEKGGAGAGSNRPFGYGVPTGKEGRTGRPLYDLTKLNRKEARIGREAVRLFLAGQSQGGVIAWMNERCTTTSGNPWKANAFRHWLSSPRIAGLVERDGQLYPAKWKGIITREQWEDAKALLQQQSDTYGYSGRERVYLLTGKAAECGSCDGPLYTKPAGKSGSRLYYCKNPACPSPVSRNVRLLDEYVIGRVMRRLNEPGFVAAIQANSAQPGLGAEVAALERRKAEAKAKLGELADHPGVDPALLAKGLASYDRKIAQLRAQMAATSQQRLLARMAGITREQWDAEPIDVRAETVRALYRVTVLPATRRGPGFDPAGVRVERR
jgi:DNA invertase Pin-like site-specific DNA recombinase